jgi:predicted MFS family arabinose efflux permease
VLIAFGVAIVLLTAFALWELRSKEPMLPLRFFKNMSFTGANVALTLVAFSMFGCFFFLSQYLQTVQSYTALEAGVRLLPMALAAFIGAVVSARIASVIGTKLTVAIGILIATSGLFYFYKVAAVDTSFASIALGMSVTSFGMGVTMSPATNSIMGSIPVDEAGVGSAMNDTTRQIGGALGVAIMGTLLNSSYAAKINSIIWPAPLPQAALDGVRGGIQGAHIVAGSVQQQSPALAKAIINNADQAFSYGMAHTLLIASIIMASAAVLVVVIVPTRVQPYRELPRIKPVEKDKGKNKH